MGFYLNKSLLRVLTSFFRSTKRKMKLAAALLLIIATVSVEYVTASSLVKRDCTKTFSMTPSHQSFIKAREMCLEMGGDIVQEMFGPDGSAYHDTIRSVIEDSGKTKVWGVGLWDEGKEGTWRFISSGAEYDVTDDDITAAYHYRPNYEPGSTSNNCLYVANHEYTGEYPCDQWLYALCEVDSC